jgi:TetR/AcrR family transcriptional regulator, transcriptional repressor for nem operon
MEDAGLTHGGFYKHFKDRNNLITEAICHAFDEVADRLSRAAHRPPKGEPWKEIVKAYLNIEHCKLPGNWLPVWCPWLRARKG